MHSEITYFSSQEELRPVEGAVARPKARYSTIVKNHVTGDRLKVELIELPFVDGRRFRVRVNGQWAQKVPVASKTVVARQVRGWLVKH
jgi:hypothetical protein